MVDDPLEGWDEVELPFVAELGKRGGDVSAIADAVQSNDRKVMCMQMQSPDPRAVFAGPQFLVEAQ
jgi:hypothetical protein